mgnify:CR=1 FL=1
MSKLLSLVILCLLVVIFSAISGQFTGGEWYQEMNHPVWSPSAAVMAIVWAVLYALMALSAWMVWDTKRSLAGAAIGWWVLQLFLGVVWSFTYFGLHRIGWAMVVIGVWLFVVMIVIEAFGSIKSQAGHMMKPVAAWLLFSLVLNFAQWRMNGGSISSVF